MFAQELVLAHETIEDGKNYESVVNAIQLEWIEQALLDTSKASIRRRRLDEAPLAALFKTSVAAWESDALVKDKVLGLSIMAVDGTTFRCQDSEDNAQAFGFISQKHKPYPQLRLVGLMATETRFMVGAAFDACQVGEVTLAHRLLADVPANSLTLFDRCYFSANLLISWNAAASNSH
ncbi:transposase, partial [Vibrio campbellii]